MSMDRRRFLNGTRSLGLAAVVLPPLAKGQANSIDEGSSMDNPFDEVSGFEQPRLEFVFEVDLDFTRVHNINNMPSGAGRGAVYVDSGSFSGPRLNGTVIPNSGGDYALFRPDGVLSFDARYMLQENDGTLILLHNKGFLWGRSPDTMDRIRAWIFDDGPVVPESDYYLRANPTFEVETGKHDWLMRHVIVGVGRRKEQGNTLRYYALL
ncbi:MAG: DUF3237 domain-containing protein [Pseudomonadales bacterium]|nr:DUF3237 domain-containing protein [Pseudomonadales bacterium]